MNTRYASFLNTPRNLIQRWRGLRSYQRYTLLGLLAVLILTLIIISRDQAGSTEEIARNRVVEVKSVRELSSDTTPLSIVGKITSVSEAIIRSESSGKLQVYRKLGDVVAAGTVIGEFENSSERAQVLSAEGAYDAALVGLERAKTGTNINVIGKVQTDSALKEAQAQALNTIESSYSAMDDAIRTKTDAAFTNPTTNATKFLVNTSDMKLVISLETERSQLETMLRARQAKNTDLNDTFDLLLELEAVSKETDRVKTYLDNLILAFNRGIADSASTEAAISGYKTNATIARSAIIGQMSGISVAKNSLTASMAAAEINKERTNLDLGDSEDILSAEAGVKSALGALRGAQSRLEKTIVRSPISGTINSLAVQNGDFVSPFSEVAIVSNNGALEVIAYVTEDDSRSLSVGGKVFIEGGAEGVITKIAPAIDPRTNKIELKIGITKTTEKLVNGQSVVLSVDRENSSNSPQNALFIPLSALKLTPSGALVFQVNEDGTLSSLPVTLGQLQGERVAVTEGIDLDLKIVTDARGLKSGMTVEVK